MALVIAFLVVGIAFAIAAAVIGWEARRLDAEAPEPVFDLDEAVQWVANHLPSGVTAELSHDDVRRVLDWSLEFFRAKSVSGNGHSAHHEGPVVVGGAETVAYVLEKAGDEGVELTAEHVHAVLEVQMTYLEAIGAVGPDTEIPPDQ